MSHSNDDMTLTAEIFPAETAVHHYVIQKLIGAGAMGIVYLALDTELERTVALKFLPQVLCRDDAFRSRFRREAQAIARLNHPNIVTVYHVDEFRGQPFIAMEHVEGGSLDDYLARHRLSIEEILELAIQICEGLSEAHGHGIVHRDIKPSNILVTNCCRAKIVDFGLAALLKKDRAADAGLIVGTAAYMSPEQVQGQPADTRSDLFSLGVVLYRILTGTTPFSGNSLKEVFQAILEKEPLPMSAYATNIPLEIERIVTRLINKKRELRYQHADDLRADLRFTLDAVISGRVQYQGGRKEYARSIAVLPFANLSADREQDYFCDGMAEEAINALAKVRGLRVAARTSTLAFKGSSEDVREIGRKLHVETLLEGSVRRSGEFLRVTVQLIDVVSGYHLWSEKFDRKIQDVFAIQDEIAQNIVRALQLILSENELQALTTAATSNSQAYDYYLRGRQFFHEGKRKSFEYAVRMFKKATEIDPLYALAYAGIADTSALIVHYYPEAKNPYLAEADAASAKALELDPGLPQAHAARAFTLWLLDRFDEAKIEFETAMRLDPGQGLTPYLYGRASFQRGEIAKAARLFEDACRKHENYEARYFAAQSYTALGNHEAALTAYRLAFREVEKHIELHPDDARAYTIGAVSLCRLGEREAGLVWADKAVAIDPSDARIQYNVACLYALEGDATRAIQSLETAFKTGFAHKDWVEKDPDLDSLRDDPRFLALVRGL